MSALIQPPPASTTDNHLLAQAYALAHESLRLQMIAKQHEWLFGKTIVALWSRYPQHGSPEVLLTALGGDPAAYTGFLEELRPLFDWAATELGHGGPNSELPRREPEQ